MKTLYSVRHSTRKFEEFMSIIEDEHYDILVDVRSKPYSRRNPQFNKTNFIKNLWDKYLRLGRPLWWFDEDVSQEEFMSGIQTLEQLAENNTVVFMCSEKDHAKCHRYIKVTPALVWDWYNVVHL